MYIREQDVEKKGAPIMRAKVIGAGGMQGEAIVYALVNLGAEMVEMVDIAPNALIAAFKRINMPKYTRVTCTNSPTDIDGQPLDLVFSAAPYNVNIEIAKQCNLAGVPYADLGGNPDVSHVIQDNACFIYPERGVPQSTVFTDLGLAPGWVSIIAEELIRGRENDAVLSMRVGGLPHPASLSIGPFPWNYGIVFSPKGLYNEYTGTCNALIRGEIQQRAALGDHVTNIPTMNGRLEAFNTKGGLGLSLEGLQRRGVMQAQYQTFRYPGHHNILNYLLNEQRYSEEQFTKVLLENCPVIKDDVVVIQVRARWFEEEQRTREIVIQADDRFTAMQKATAFPAAAAALMMTQGMVEMFSPVCEYQGIPARMFNEYLKRLELIR